MALQDNKAYDFAMFEPKPKEGAQPERRAQKNNVISLPEKELEKNRRPKLHPFKMLSFFVALIFTVGTVGMLIYGQVQMTELTEKINTANKSLDESKSIYTQLQMKSAAELSLDSVEDYAKNQLGMQKIEKNQVEYIGISGGDQGQVLNGAEDENIFTAIWNWLQQLLS